MGTGKVIGFILLNMIHNKSAGGLLQKRVPVFVLYSIN